MSVRSLIAGADADSDVFLCSERMLLPFFFCS